MTFHKSLAASGLILCFSSPAGALSASAISAISAFPQEVMDANVMDLGWNALASPWEQGGRSFAGQPSRADIWTPDRRALVFLPEVANMPAAVVEPMSMPAPATLFAAPAVAPIEHEAPAAPPQAFVAIVAPVIEWAQELAAGLAEGLGSVGQAVAAVVTTAYDGATQAVGQLVTSVTPAVAASKPATVGAATVTLAVAPPPAAPPPPPASKPEAPLTVAPAPAPVAPVEPAPAASAPPRVDDAVPEAIASGQGRTFFVDYASGNDSNAGTSAAAPWKHAPGDPAAKGAAASIALKPGDTVRFRGGVPYRGTIVLKASGTAAAPIVYTGQGFGTGRAIFDGADPVTSSVACPSASACGGATNWQQLRLVQFADPDTAHKRLFDQTGPLQESTVPTVADPFFADDTASYVTIPRSAATMLAAGRIEHAQLADAARGQPNARLSLWVQPNSVQEFQILSVAGNVIQFDLAGRTPYTNRDSFAAITGSVRGVVRPGTYAILAPGRAVVFPRAGGGDLLVGTGRRGIHLRQRSHVVIRGFHFQRQTSSTGSTREGLSIYDLGQPSSNVVIEDNRFGPSSMRNGYGAVHLNNVTGLTIRRNRFIDLQWGSGVRLGSRVSNAVLEDNRLSRGGRTGLFFQSSSNVIVRRNIVSGYSGRHGNAISVYSTTSNVSIVGNCVFGSIRPLTWSGGSKTGHVTNLVIRNNILIASPEGTAAMHSWGGRTNKVMIENNLLGGRLRGAILSAADIAVTATGNRASGRIVLGSGQTPPSFVIANNDESPSYAAVQQQTQVSLEGCTGKGKAGTLSIVPN